MLKGKELTLDVPKHKTKAKPKKKEAPKRGCEDITNFGSLDFAIQW